MNMLDKIQLLMEQNNIKNLHQLSDKSGIPYETLVSMFKKDYKNTKLATLSKLRIALNCSLDYLVIEDEKDITESTDEENLVLIDNIKKLDVRQKQVISEVVKSQLGMKTNDIIKPLKVFDQPACAGNGHMVDEESYEIVEFSNPPITASFCVRIQGDSMSPLIKNGQVVYVQANVVLQENDIAIVCYQGDCFCKVIKRKNNEVTLTSLNKNYEDITVFQADEFSIIGRVL